MFDYVDDIFETAGGVETDFSGWDTDIFSGGTTDPTLYADDGAVFADQVAELPESPVEGPDAGARVYDAQPQTGAVADSNAYDMSYGSEEIVQADGRIMPDGGVPGTQTIDSGSPLDVVKRAYQVGKTVVGDAPAKAKGVITPTVRTEANKSGAAAPLPTGVETPKLADIFGQLAAYGKAASQGAKVVQDFKTKVTQADARAKQTIAIKRGTVAAGLRDDQKGILLVGAVAAAAFLL